MLRESWIQIPQEIQIFSAMYPHFHAGITFRQLIFHKKQKYCLLSFLSEEQNSKT